MLGGLIAWLAVSLPFALMQDDATSAEGATEPALVLQLAMMALAGLAAGPVLGGTQALVLRRVTRHPWAWVWANARAWAVGLPIIQLGAGGMPVGTPTVVMVAGAALALFVAGGARLGESTGRRCCVSARFPRGRRRSEARRTRSPVEWPMGHYAVFRRQVRERTSMQARRVLDRKVCTCPST